MTVILEPGLAPKSTSYRPVTSVPKQPSGLFCRHERSVVSGLLNSYFSTADRAAAEEADFALLIRHDAVAGSMNGEVAADFGAGAGALAHADLADNDLAGFDLFATKQLNAETLARTIVDVFGCTTGFDM
jgi:hypothetical protein